MAEHIVQPFHSVQAVPDSIGDSKRAHLSVNKPEESMVRPNAVSTQEPTGTFWENRCYPTGQLKTFPVQRASSNQAVSSYTYDFTISS